MQKEILIPSNVSQHTLKNFLNSNSFFENNVTKYTLVFHPRFSHLEPFAIAMLGAWADYWVSKGVEVECEAHDKKFINYFQRMRLFDYIKNDDKKDFVEHESAGKFVPLVKISKNKELKDFLIDVIPLLHSPDNADAVVYCLSELIRNVIEHAGGASAYACAQYYKKSNKVSIGVADCGIGVRESMHRSYMFENDASALVEALKPGVTGTTSVMYGGKDNAGAGLFYSKSIAHASEGYFSIISGNSAYRLRRARNEETLNIRPNPLDDRHDLFVDVPTWQGTVVGMDINIAGSDAFNYILGTVKSAYDLYTGTHAEDLEKLVKFT